MFKGKGAGRGCGKVWFDGVSALLVMMQSITRRWQSWRVFGEGHKWVDVFRVPQPRLPLMINPLQHPAGHDLLSPLHRQLLRWLLDPRLH